MQAQTLEPQGSAWWRSPAIQAAAIIVACLLVFSPVMLGGGFFWDDYILLVNNNLVREPGFRGLLDIWTSTRNPDYFPLTSTSFWLEWRLWGDWASPYHVTNVLLHAASSVMLWRILLRLKMPGAFVAALLFAVHPVNVESVAWIAERKNTLCMFFACISVLLHLREKPAADAAAIVCFALSLLAKTATVMLPVVLLIVAWWRHGRITPRDLLRSAPYFALSAAMGIVTLWFQYTSAIQDVVVRNDSFASRLATAGCAVWFYLGKALLPVDIAFQYPRWDVMAHGALAFVPLLLLAVLFVALWLTRRKAALASLAAYVVLLLPILGFLNIFFMRYSLVSDHWQYPAIPCVLALAAAALMRLRLERNILLGLTATIVAVLMIYSASIAAVYRSAESIWLDTLAHNPDSWLAHANLGELYLDRARQDGEYLPRAIDHLQKVVELQPKRALGYTNLGNALLLANRRDEAATIYSKGLALNEGSADERARMHTNVGSLDAMSGHTREAIAHFQEAIRLEPNFPPPHFNLGVLLAEEKPDEARIELRRAAELNPNYFQPRLFLARLELQSHNPTAANKWAQEALKIDPYSQEARKILQQTHPATTR
jgi:tetratricopeptide (TPR) repeat protein